jgi:hypothetical protein
MTVATAIPAGPKRLAPAWSVAKTSSSAPETLRRLNQPDRQAGIAFASSFYNESDVVCVQPCGFSGPMSQARACICLAVLTDSQNLDALSLMRSVRLPSSIDGIEAE